VQDPLEASDLEAEINQLQQHADDGSTASFAAWLAAKTLKAPGALEAQLPDLESGPVLEAIEAAVAVASPLAPGLDDNTLEQTATPDGVPPAARDLLPAVTHRCVCACCWACATMLIARGVMPSYSAVSS